MFGLPCAIDSCYVLIVLACSPFARPDEAVTTYIGSGLSKSLLPYLPTYVHVRVITKSYSLQIFATW